MASNQRSEKLSATDTMLEFIDFVTPNDRGDKCGVFLCECGKITFKLVKDFKSRKIKSCGCYRHKWNRRHGKSSSSIYHTYNGMMERCYNKKSLSYKNYGGRGITVCERWLESFKFFLDDMGEKPSCDYTLDRINNDGPYSPENCKWSTRKEQIRNRRVTKYITFYGERKTLAEWSSVLKIPAGRLYYRMRNGLSDHEIIGISKFNYQGDNLCLN